ncbi:MAG: hypothetical protein FJ224_04280 [Lentisphaerae bacterium]|nr:hypothetical protein [Lentisphaerota bacterium]
MLRFRQFTALAALAAGESLRQPIFLLLSLTCVAWMAALPVVLMHKFGEDGKLVREGALALHFVFGILVTGHAASWSLAREMRGGTAAAVLTKPVGRDMFYLAKYAGIVSVAVAFSVCAALATLLSERVSERFVADPVLGGYVTDWNTARMVFSGIIVSLVVAGVLNYRWRFPFQSSGFGLLAGMLLLTFIVRGQFDIHGRLSPMLWAYDWRIVPASLLITLALAVFAAIALALSTRFPAAPTVAACCGVLLVGLVSDYVFGTAASRSFAAATLHRVLPNWQNFWMADALADGGVIPGWYLLEAATYAGVYSAAVLALGLTFFRRSDVG